MNTPFYPITICAATGEEGTSFAAHVPDLKGVTAAGGTPQEAMANILRAIEDWCARQVAEGCELPAPGSAERARVAEKEAILALVYEQDAAVKQQERELNLLREDIDGVKAQVSELADKEDKLLKSDPKTTWLHRPYFVAMNVSRENLQQTTKPKQQN